MEFLPASDKFASLSLFKALDVRPVNFSQFLKYNSYSA